MSGLLEQVRDCACVSVNGLAVTACVSVNGLAVTACVSVNGLAVTACVSVNGLGVSLVCDCLCVSPALSVSVWIHNKQSISHFVSPHAKPQIVPLECSRPTDPPPCAFRPAGVSSRSHTDELEGKLDQGQRTCNEVAAPH